MKLALMSELIGRSMYSMTIFGVQAPDSGNMELLAHGATDEQKERWLWPNLRGDISSAFALTEPFLAGADPTRIATSAVLDGDEWVINGHKWFVSNGSVADIILVFAETNPENRPHRHASMFVVPAGTPGHGDRARHPDDGAPRRRVRRTRATTPRSSSTTAACPPTTSSGARATASCSRRSVSAAGASTTRCAGSARRRGRFDIMCERAVSRESHGKLLGQHQMIQDFIALSHTEIQAARLLTFQTAWKMDKYGASAVRADISMVKAHVSRMVLTRARPHDPGVRRARATPATCPSRAGTAAPGSGRSATVPTRCTRASSPAPCSRTTGRSRAGRPSTSRAVGRPRSRSGRSCAPRPVSPRLSQP